MPELITEEQPRVKFISTRARSLNSHDLDDFQDQLLLLSQLMSRMEAIGAAPVLNDGLVGGNCGIRLRSRRSHNTVREQVPPSTGPPHTISGGEDDFCIFVSRSGKPPGHSLQPSEFVQLINFNKTEWSAEYASSADDQRPTSDSPLLYSCLSPEVAAWYGWTQCPTVALHGHALASGEGLAKARELGLPVSSQETLFSTPEDLQALEALFFQQPYPAHKCFVRTGHGFFIVGQDIADVEDTFARLVEPHVGLETS